MLIGHLLALTYSITPLSALFEHHAFNIAVLVLILINLISLYFLLNYRNTNKLLHLKIEGIWKKLEERYRKKIKESDKSIQELTSQLRECNEQSIKLSTKNEDQKEELEKLNRKLNKAKKELEKYEKSKGKVFVEFYVDNSRADNVTTS